MTTEQSLNGKLDTTESANNKSQTDLLHDELLRDSASTQPPFIDEHDFDTRFADTTSYDGLTL